MTVNEALERIFIKNESRTEKWTDEQIGEMLQSRYPGTAASRLEEIRGRRHAYNTCLPPFQHLTQPGTDPARPISRQYDANGVVIPPSRTINRRVQVVGGLTEDRAREIMREEMANRPNLTIVVAERRSEVTLPAGTAHKCFHKALRKLTAGVPVLLVGPAGSGKTYLARQLAKAMGLPFTFNSMSAGSTEAEVLGRTLPDDKGNWTFQEAPYTLSYRDGGLHLFDEVDAADENMLVKLNASIANGVLALPFAPVGKQQINRHKDSYIIAAANTFGQGGDRMYVGRNQLDAATLNRFTMGTITVDYDRDLERNIAVEYLKDEVKAESLLAWAWRVRDGIAANKLRRILSTRNIEDCCKCLLAGDELSDLREDFFQGWSTDERRLVNGN